MKCKFCGKKLVKKWCTCEKFLQSKGVDKLVDITERKGGKRILRLKGSMMKYAELVEPIKYLRRFR